MFLQGYLIDEQPASVVTLPDVADTLNTDRQVFQAQDALTKPTYVWQLPASDTPAMLLSSGTVKFGNTILCPDYWNHHVLVDRLQPRPRTIVEVDTLVAPFGHIPDGITFGGYYDFIYLIFAKLCRIEKTLPEGFSNAAIAYPLFNTDYETELLTLLGFTPDRIFDSRQVDVRSKRCLLANGGDWFHPNLSDLALVYDRLQPLLVTDSQPPFSDRVFISRGGRRRIIHEDVVMNRLSEYDFTFIEDKPRTIAEQINLYHHASIILGPHGASFSNINWCRPGTHLHELCSANYSPDFFLYLAQVRQMSYSVSLHGKVRRQSIRRSLVEDIPVTVSEIERVVERLLTAQLNGAEAR